MRVTLSSLLGVALCILVEWCPPLTLPGGLSQWLRGPLSDAFHYMHRRYFERNYAGFWSSSFGRSKRMTSGNLGRQSILAITPLFGVHCLHDSIVFLCGCRGCGACAVAHGSLVISSVTTIALSSTAGFGPVLLATAFSLGARGGSLGGTDIVPKRAPLSSCMHLFIGSLPCAVPITVTS